MGEDPNRRGVPRRWIIAEVENSLRRLGTDWIDLYQMHRPDPETDSQLPAADVALDAAVLDRIDAIVRPGVNLNPADTSYGEHVRKPALRRR
jgi:aryl-alcohol dehydrogenase-like predicted oxidoreductase